MDISKKLVEYLTRLTMTLAAFCIGADAHAARPKDPQFLAVDHTVGGLMYLLTVDGDLLFYKDEAQNGTSRWGAGSGSRVHMQTFVGTKHFFSGHNGVFYMVDSDGNLRWYRDLARDGSINWDVNSGAIVGTEWQVFSKVFAGGDGVIYGIKPDGGLYWYRHSQDHRFLWANNSGAQIGSGWDQALQVCATPQGHFYVVDSSGNLRWYQDLARNGTFHWATASGSIVGSGWRNIRNFSCTSDGTIYGVNPETGHLHWYRDAAQNGTFRWAPGTGGVAGHDWMQRRRLPDLNALGYGTLTMNGAQARGARPTLGVLVRYTDQGGVLKAPAYYNQLIFSDYVEAPFVAPDNPASLNEFFRENSNDFFSLQRAGAGLIQLNMGPLGADPGPEERFTRILQALGRLGYDFARFDTNNDGIVGAEELIVITFENFPVTSPANRPNNPIALNGKTIALRASMNGADTPFDSIAHETAHSFATQDMYYNNCNAQSLSLMSCTSFRGDLQNPKHLDAWHKFRLGWIRPKMYRIDVSDSAFVDFSTAFSMDGAVLLWDGRRPAGEFFLVERRNGSTPGINGAPKYETQAGDGFAVWKIGNGVRTLGADGQISSSVMWAAGESTQVLRWDDGSSAEASLSFHWDPAHQRYYVRW